MKIVRGPIAGNYQIEIPAYQDFRGTFKVFWEDHLFDGDLVSFRPIGAYHSFNLKRATIRAFHFQKSPYCQNKLVSCVSGRAWDVAADVTPGSPTFGQWSALEISPGNGLAHLIPAGCAHGFATLEDNTTIAYLVDGEYRPESAAVVRWSDPVLSVAWPVTDPIISNKDKQAPSIETYLSSL